MRGEATLAADYASQLLLKRGFVVVEGDAPQVLTWLEDPGGVLGKPVAMAQSLKLHFKTAHSEQVRRDEPDSDEDEYEDDCPVH